MVFRFNGFLFLLTNAQNDKLPAVVVVVVAANKKESYARAQR